MSLQLNDAEKCLIERWQDVVDVKECLRSIDSKQDELLQSVLRRVLDAHPQFVSVCYPAKRKMGPVRQIGLGKKSWPASSGYVSGFWLNGVDVASLLGSTDDSPTAVIWIGGDDSDLHVCNRCIDAVRNSVETILEASERKLWRPGNKRDALEYSLPEDKSAFKQMLLSGDGKDLIGCLEKHLESLFRFTEVIDDAVARSKAVR
ncbi:MAG TPA: hypothetical protein VKX17_05695 [Planctomycetota bacterium]|nr:hypothetical protein [Planctomycetota bacterium]